MKPLSCRFGKHADSIVEVKETLFKIKSTPAHMPILAGYTVTTKCLRCGKVRIHYKFELSNEEFVMLKFHHLELLEKQQCQSTR